ncbi:MAG: hypothetical protein HYW48_02395 [Deltaproteobacteria bacterium]|nr:hypothetical protein [Deltaproteobacteria bacterium]
MSVSLRPDIVELAERTENKSKFFETSVDVVMSLRELVAELKKRKMDITRATQDLEDLVDVWEAQFDSSVPFSSARTKKPVK